VSRSLAIVAVAALIGAALGAAVTLPALVVSGEDSPPAALSLATGSKRIVVRATHLPATRIATRRAPSQFAPPAPAASTPPSGSALASAPASQNTALGTIGSVSRTVMKAPKHAKPTNRPKPPAPTVLPPPPPASPPPPLASPPAPPAPPPASGKKDHGNKEKASKKLKHEKGSKSKHEEKGEGESDEHGHGHGNDKGHGQRENGHGHEHGDESGKGHGPKR
jgi:hypothetical protein